MLGKHTSTFHIAGSLQKGAPDYEVVKKNFCALIHHLLLGGHRILIRQTPKVPPPRELVDEICLAVASKMLDEKQIKKEQLQVIRASSMVSRKRKQAGLRGRIIDSDALTLDALERDACQRADMLLGVGGAFGLSRLAYLTHHMRKPVVFLRGVGGTAEVCWADVLQHPLMRDLDVELRDKIKAGTNLTDVDSFDPIEASGALAATVLSARKTSSEGPVDLEQITIPEMLKTSKRFQLSSWIFLGGAVSVIFGLGYWFGGRGASSNQSGSGASKILNESSSFNPTGKPNREPVLVLDSAINSDSTNRVFKTKAK